MQEWELELRMIGDHSTCEMHGPTLLYVFTCEHSPMSRTLDLECTVGQKCGSCFQHCLPLWDGETKKMNYWEHKYCFSGFIKIKQNLFLHFVKEYNMWPDLPKGVLYMHNFKSHFSPPFNRYNNRLTYHAYTIAKGSMVYFYWGLIHGPVCCLWMLGWSVSGSNLPGQADSQ